MWRLVFPVFGAASASTAALPIAFILTVTAIRDGVEDYRRAALDEEVNTSACTKLGNWRNVNQPTDPRPWFERLLGINAPGRVTKGVRKLREKDVGEGMRGILGRDRQTRSMSMGDLDDNSLSLSAVASAGERRLDDIQSVDSSSYPATVLANARKSSVSSVASKHRTPEEIESWNNTSTSTYQPSMQSKISVGVVDWKKHAGGSTRWERTLWKKLEVGDIVFMRDNEQVPADIVVLSTSDPDGMCYLETKNLDGETNLKPRRACRATSTIVSEDDVERSSFVLDSEPPHQNLYAFQAVMRYKDAATDEDKRESVSINELLLRGCALRNTTWIIGLVVFTGADTKIMLNGGETPSKRSKIEKETNFNVIANFIVLIGMCTIAAIFSGVYEDRSGTSSDFYEIDSEPTHSSILNSIVTFV
jgi:phospholipid-translocating ATPase